MDDDPEPTLDQMILESHDVNEQLLNFREQKCAAEINEESTLESGDIGPAVDPETPKKSVAVKDSLVQTESKTSIFRRKEWMDQSQQVDLNGSVKSSSTSLRKPSRRSSQRLIGQESRRSSQQPPSQLPPLSQKPSRGQVINEADMKDPSCVSQRTGKVMTTRSQQTSLVWERKALSEILHPSSDESIPSKDEESEFTTAEEYVTSSGETGTERYPRQESRHGSKQLEGKVSKHSSQQRLERFGSRRSSQRSSELQYALGPKYSRVHATKGTDSDEDVTWINQRTGREMKCKAQQTIHKWGSRAHSGAFSSSRQDSQEEQSGFSTTDEVTSGETGTEESTTQESSYSSQREGGVSKHTSWQQLGRSETHRNSQPTTEQPYLLHLKYSRDKLAKERTTEEQPFWINQQTGKEMKCRSQQTSLVWEQTTFSEVVKVYNPVTASVAGAEYGVAGEEDSTEDEERDTKTNQAAMKDAQHRIQSVEAEKCRQDIQEAEEQKPELLRKKHKYKIDRAQQTDSCESIRKELADDWQQTDVFEDVKMSSEDLRQVPSRGSEPTDVQGSRRSSKEFVQQDSAYSSPQPELRDSQRSSQQSLRSTAKTAEEEESLRSMTKTAEEEDESKGPSDIETEPSKLEQKASRISAAEETTWVSRKTGRVVRNQGQQTDRSWLRYFALKSQKLKRSTSQQTDESFLQWYKSNKLKQVVNEHRKNHAESDMRRCTLCGDLYGEDFSIDLDALSSFSTLSCLSTISSEEVTETESSEEKELSIVEAYEEQPQMQQSLEQESQQANEESPKGVGQESQRGSPEIEDDQILARGANEFENKTASESSLLYTEGEEKLQQTYSMISFEDGIWLNRKTGKLLVTHGQQTSETSLSKDLEQPESAEEEGLAPAEADDSSTGVNRDVQQEIEADGPQPLDQESRRGSRQDQDGEPPLLPEQLTEDGLQTADEVEKLVCSRLSEATLLSIESPDMEDGPVQVYIVVSLEKGTWRNVMTGKLLASQSQQTEAPSEQNSPEGDESVKVPSQRSPEEGQVDIP